MMGEDCVPRGFASSSMQFGRAKSVSALESEGRKMRVGRGEGWGWGWERSLGSGTSGEKQENPPLMETHRRKPSGNICARGISIFSLGKAFFLVVE